MSKKGFIEFIGAGVVIAIVMIGGLLIMFENQAPIQIKYVGNTLNNKFCSIDKYDFNKIPEDYRIFFEDEQKAIKNGFIYSNECN